jgi:hypothetical protein
MVFLFSRVLPGNRLDHAKTDQQSRGKRQQNGPSVERKAIDRGWIGHMWILLWLVAIADVLWNYAKKEGTSDNNNRWRTCS